jgi:nucleotide-binding universal stress UspA family protein
MERILVAMDVKHQGWEALSHACSLAKRLDVEINVLLVALGDIQKRLHPEMEIENELRKRLALRIEAAKADGVLVNFFITEGGYEDEIVSFVKKHRITMLMVEKQGGDTRTALSSGKGSLRTLRHRLTCRMEVVIPKTQ